MMVFMMVTSWLKEVDEDMYWLFEWSLYGLTFVPTLSLHCWCSFSETIRIILLVLVVSLFLMEFINFFSFASYYNNLGTKKVSLKLAVLLITELLNYYTLTTIWDCITIVESDDSDWLTKSNWIF